MSSDYQRIVRDGLWDNNGVLAMLLGLCPTMAMTTNKPPKPNMARIHPPPLV